MWLNAVFICLFKRFYDKYRVVRGKIISKCTYTGGDPTSIIYELCNPLPSYLLAWPQKTNILFTSPTTALIFIPLKMLKQVFICYCPMVAPNPLFLSKILHVNSPPVFLLHVRVSKADITVMWAALNDIYKRKNKGSLGRKTSKS